MNENTIDQTGYGFSSGGFAPTFEDSLSARRNKAEMDRMSDFMQKFDPTINRSVETMVRAQVRNGATPEEARRAAFGSAQGQIMSDVMLGLRRAGFLGQGDPINTGRNFLQGVSGGGFSMDVLGPGGTVGMNQSVMGGGLISGMASQQMAKDVMTNIYGEGGSNPADAFGFNMEETSGVFRKMAERGGLGNIGKLTTYSDDKNSEDYKGGAKAVNDKLNIARRQEVDKEIKAALEGTTADNIDSKIKEALEKGDTQVAKALGEIQTGSSSFALDDKNTKRVSELTEETIKGLANLKDVYGELNSQQLLAKMEAITGITISNKDEARKAAKMTSSITNMAVATGNDPRAVQEMMIARQRDTQIALAGMFGVELGPGGSRGSIGKELTGNVQRFVVENALSNEAAARSNATDAEGRLGVKLRDVSKEDFLADTETQTLKYADQNRAMVLMSGQGKTTLSGDKDFQKKRRELEARMARAKDPGESEAINDEAEELIRSRNNGKGADELMKSAAGAEEFNNADWRQVSSTAVNASAMAAVNNRSDEVIKAVMGEGNASNDTISEAFKRMGVTGVMDLTVADGEGKGNRLAGKELQAQLDKMVGNKTLSQKEADAMREYVGKASDSQYKENATSIGNGTAVGQSYHDTQIAKAEVESRTNEQQRSLYSEGKDLSLKSLTNAILSPDDKGFDTEAKRAFAMETLQKAGLGGDTKQAAKVNFEDGVSAKEMEGIRKASGDKNFSLHDRMGFNTEEDLLAATQGEGGADVKRQMQDLLGEDTNLRGGGTQSDYSYRSNDIDEVKKDDELLNRARLAVKFGQLQGAEAGSPTEAMKEYVNTGKVSAGGIGIEMGADEDQTIYDENGRTYGSVMRTFSDAKLDRVHYKKAANYDKLASRFNSKEEGADMIAINGMSGGGMLRGMEAQLDVMKADRADDARIIETTGEDGKKAQLDMDAAIKNLTEAISKAKADDGKGQTVQHMTVTKLYCDEIGPKSK